MKANRMMNYDEVREAYDAYCRITHAPRNTNTKMRFYAFLENSEDNWLFTSVGVTVSDITATRIQWLRGPNAETLYKIWRARNENV